ncbi:MAG: PD-(D/E)XK nuclease family protein [Gelidibacter sp.]|nr:PD-(D/E)XK nuclease family protein [Gelidibacter sp.]
MKKLNLPKVTEDGIPYLSFSQYNMWKKNKRNYIRQYIFGEKDTTAHLEPYGDFGHMVGNALETGDFSEFKGKDLEFMKKIPRYDEFERKVVLQMDGFISFGFIDTNTKPNGYVEKIADYKTGEIEKRKPDYESEDYIQLELYAAGLEQEFGKLPDDAKVYLIERHGSAFANEELVLGDKLEVIEKPLTPERIKQVLDNFQSVAEEIALHYEVFLKLNSI